MRSFIGFALVIIAILSGCAQATSGDSTIVNETHIPASFAWGKPKTMLVLGNSICQIPGEWGMSASSPEKDYVHLLAGKIGCTFFARNSWDVEQTYETYDFEVLPDADMVIIQLGDNMEKHHAGYSKYLSELVRRYEGKTVILISTILDNNRLGPVDAEIKRAAIQCNVPYIDIRDIMTDETNVGTLYHPNDKGMAEIAEQIYEMIKKYQSK